MKPSQLAAVLAVALAMSVIATNRSVAQATDPVIPIGELSAFPTVVQTGTRPKLNWNILYPCRVGDMVTIQPPGTFIIKTRCYVTVQVIGIGGDSSSSFGDLRASVSGGSYFQLFYGTQASVNPLQELYIKRLDPGQTFDLGGRYVLPNNTWSPFYTTKSSNMQVVSLIHGSTPPTSTPLQRSTVVNYLKPYLDSSGKVNVGPLSVLVLMELNHTDRLNPGFDLQDQVAIVTFSPKQPNNGHGNNLDGVDSSNPGGGKGGPGGGIDPSGGFDDEIR